MPQLALAQDAIGAPAQKQIGATKTEIVPSLIVMNAQGASLQGDTLTLNGVASNSIIFADRPVRSAGHALTTHLLEEWGTDSDASFAKDPPNATVSVFNKDGSKVRDAVVVFKSPKLEGDRLTFAVQVLEGDLSGRGRTRFCLHRHYRSATDPIVICRCRAPYRLSRSLVWRSRRWRGSGRRGCRSGIPLPVPSENYIRA